MRVKEYLLSRIAVLLGFPNIADYVYAFLSIGYPSGESVPKVLVDFNILNVMRGLFTRFVVSTNLDWIWPFWMERQFYAIYPDFSARGFNPASINTTHRNWTGIGDLDSEHESIVDPRGLLTPYNNSWSLDTWIQLDGKIYSPAKLPEVRQALHKNLPIVKTEYELKDKLTVKLTAFAGEYTEDLAVSYQKVEVKNITKHSINAYFAFAFRPYNPEGIALINKLHFKDTGEVLINDRLAAVLMQTPNGITTSSLSKGDVQHYFDEAKNNKIFDQRSSRVGMATGITVYKLDLTPGKTASFEIRLPTDPEKIKNLKNFKKISAFAQIIRENSFEFILGEQVQRWQKKLSQGLNISVPDSRIQHCFEANKAYILMFYDNDYITPGPATYHDFWFRDATYMLNALGKLGYHQEVKNVLDTYKHRIHASGFFYSQAGEWDSNGQAIWSLVEYYRLTRDKSFLKENYNIIYRAAKWIIYKAKTNLKLDPGYQGLMPPGLSAEHFGLNDYYYWDDFWSLAGLNDAIYAGKILEKKTQHFEKGYEDLLKAVNTSLQYTEARLGSPIMPISPSRRMDSAAIGCLSAYYPCRIFKPDYLQLVNTLDYLQEKCTINGGFFHDVNHAGHGTYLTMHIAQCYIGLRNKKALDILNWLLCVASPTFCWPEAIHPRTLGGCIGDGHHGWAAADYILLIRNMLFLEEEDHLVLTPVIPESWLAKGKKIIVVNAPTYFGIINFEIEMLNSKTILLSFNPKFSSIPKHIEWNLPYNIVKVQADNKSITIRKNKVIFPSRTKKIKVIVSTLENN